MTLWYDISDLMGWSQPHVTGIQRAVVGIHNGLVALGARPRLVRWDGAGSRFIAVEPAALPATIRDQLVHDRRPAEQAAPPPRLPEAAAAAATAAAWLERLLRAVGGTPRGRPQGAARPPERPAAASRPAGAPLGAGDVVVSLGANWHAGHVSAAAALRPVGVRLVRMVYDLIPTLKPQWMQPEMTRAITLWVREALAHSDLILTISEFSRREIEGYCDESGMRLPAIEVVRLGDELTEVETAGDWPPLPRFVPSRPFFLCVSTLDVRKNQRLLFDAWSRLAAADASACPDLLCIGTPHLFSDDILHEIRGDWAVNGRMHVLHGIADAELRWYYRHCLATIYPSRYEGWGLPVAESLARGKLCLASRAASIPEISPDLPEFFAPHDVDALVGLVRRVLDDPDWVRRREEAIRGRFRPTRWTDTATQVLAAIGRTARETAAAA